MKLTGITVCLDEPCSVGGIVDSEYLRKCIQNKEQLERWIIATSTCDITTIDLCKKYGLEFVAVEKTSTLSREKLLNKVLNTLDLDTWVICLETDIVLPENLRIVWDNELKSKSNLYTISRIADPRHDIESAKKFYKELESRDGGLHIKEALSKNLFKSKFNVYKKQPITEHLQIWNLTFQQQQSEDWLVFRKKFLNVKILSDCFVTYLRPIYLWWECLEKSWGGSPDKRKIKYIEKHAEKIFRKAKISGGGKKWDRLSDKNKIRYIRNNPEKIIKYLI